MFASLLFLLSMFLLTVLPLEGQMLKFSARQDISTPAQRLTGLAIADFNGDGHPDLAVTDVYSRLLYIYLNDASGHFSTPLITTVPPNDYAGLGPLVSGDVNEDGKQDLIVGPVGGTETDILLLGNGDGTFQPGQPIPSTLGFQNAALVDLNGDKHLDLVSGGNAFLTISLGDGRGGFEDVPLADSSGPGTLSTGLTVGDFNGDQYPDFVSANYDSYSLTSFFGVGDGNFHAPSTISSTQFGNVGFALASADFNGDGQLDLLVSEADEVILLPGNGNGTFQTDPDHAFPIPLPFKTGQGIPQYFPLIATADLDGNKTPDIVAADDNYGLLSTFLNDGTGDFLSSSADFQAPLDPGSGILRLADLNGDGLPDIVVTNYKTQKVSIFLSIFTKTTPGVTLQTNGAQALVGSSIAVTAAVKGSGNSVPTGTVTLTSGSNSYGQEPLDGTGQAVFTLAALPVGQYALTASYSGDAANNASSNATPLLQSITDFQAVLATPSQTAAVGATATYNLEITPLSGFTGTVMVTCSGLPTGFTCAPVSSAIGAQPSSIALVVSPPTMTAAVGVDLHDRSWAGATLAVLCCGGLGFCLRKRRLLVGAGLTLMVLCVGSMVGCSSPPAPAQPTPPAPYRGSSNFMITATTTQGSVTVSHAVSASLTVQ